MKYNKLVRDNVPQHIKAKGEAIKTHTAGDVEYWSKLKEKLLEEVGEFNKDESVEELADLLEVIDAIIEYKKFDRGEIEKVKGEKAETKGGFKNRIILDES